MTDAPLCALCARPMVDTAYVCDRCGDKTQTALERVVLVAGEAMTTIAKQSRMGAGGRRTDTEAPLPVDLHAADDHDAAINTLTTWARHVNESSGRALPRVKPGEHPTAVVARWLVRQLDWLRHREEAVEALAQLSAACRVLERVVDRPADRWYAGNCDCGEGLYPIAGARAFRCRSCATVHDLEARKSWLLDQAEDVLAGAAWCAATLNRLGVATTASTIRTWAERSRLASHGFDPMGRPLYRLGTVRELVLEAAEDDRMRRLVAAVRKADRDEKARRVAASLTTDHEAETLTAQAEQPCPQPG